MEQINGVKVFSATKFQERDVLGEKVTAWIRDQKNVTLVDVVITQSSDEAFHCLTITVLYKEDLSATGAPRRNPRS
jgi:hypothetical protein